MAKENAPSGGERAEQGNKLETNYEYVPLLSGYVRDVPFRPVTQKTVTGNGIISGKKLPSSVTPLKCPVISLRPYECNFCHIKITAVLGTPATAPNTYTWGIMTIRSAPVSPVV